MAVGNVRVCVARRRAVRVLRSLIACSLGDRLNEGALCRSWRRECPAKADTDRTETSSLRIRPSIR